MYTHPFLTNQRLSLIKDAESRKLAFIPSQVTEEEAISLGMLEEPEVGGEGGMQRGSGWQLEIHYCWHFGTFNSPHF